MKKIIILFFLVTAILILQALHTEWRYHLRVDLDGQYYQHAKTFFDTLSLKNLGYNEYMPGALLFFLFLSPSLFFSLDSNSLLTALFTANILLFAALVSIFKKFAGLVNTLIFLLFVLMGGPIILYRFELFVCLFVILSLIFWTRKREILSMYLLGVATAIKIFPLILFPYFFLLSLKSKNYASIFKNTASYFLGCLTPLGIFYYLGGTLESFKASLAIHADKPVHAESIFAVFLTLGKKLLTGHFAKGAGDLGIYGIARSDTIGPLFFYNYFWVFVLAIFYVYLAYKIYKGAKYSHLVSAVIILLYLISSKILTAQYIYWFAFIFPLVPPVKKFWWIGSLVLTAATLLLTQTVYPLHYNALLGCFFETGECQQFFWELAARNFLLIIIAVILLQKISWEKLSSR